VKRINKTGPRSTFERGPEMKRCLTQHYLQQVGQAGQQVSPQQSAPQQSLQHVGQLVQHASPPQHAPAACGAGAMPAVDRSMHSRSMMMLITSLFSSGRNCAREDEIDRN
jgi:hypothetical protein